MADDQSLDIGPQPAAKANPDALQNRRIGALWTKTSKGGNMYLAGRIKVGDVDVGVTVMKNSRKDQAKHPDYEVFLMREEVVKEIPL